VIEYSVQSLKFQNMANSDGVKGLEVLIIYLTQRCIAKSKYFDSRYGYT
jgi:hypothetical protein